MPRWSKRLVGLCAALALSVGLPTGVAVADPPAPPPSYSYFGGVAAQLTAPSTPPPGANDWSCRPSAAHPEPVVLLHGLSNDTITWNTLAPVLNAAGFCVFTATYGTGPLGPIGAITPVEESAAQIGAFIDRVLAATGAAKVDIVGHSMGGAVPFYYLNHLGGIPKIDDYVAMAAPLHGTTLSGLQSMFAGLVAGSDLEALLNSTCGPCQMSWGSPFLRTLNPDPAIAPAIRFTTVVSRYDEIATPYTTGMLEGPNVRNIVLQDLCSTDYTEHYELTADPVAVRAVLDTLDPARAGAPTCAVVLPFIGPIGR
ncbi:alpha/beta fold hydrolase [Nocardia sp. NEAU-351]|uniref:Alpha/beta fold hydrolase n=2 Tax=Nocardia bovistercoris TaxID=2785916 RepID=A0A931I713_9NOCA|nr:alpha/beta fold hydrolase [Nocardia bovistercoris]